MVGSKKCKAKNEQGRSCGATPMHDSEFCVFHDPESAGLLTEARRAGGNRRKREATVKVAYDFEGLGSYDQITRLVEVAASDTLAEPTSLARSRTLAYLAQVASALHGKGNVEDRLAAVEARLDGDKPQRRRRRGNE